MALEMQDYRFGEHLKTVNDFVLIMLAKESPLTIGQVAKKLRADFKVSITFQGVRKSLHTLTRRKVLESQGTSYRISKQFILEAKRLSDQMMKNYFPGDKGTPGIRWTETSITQKQATYTFEDFIRADQFCNEIILDWAYNRKEGEDSTFCFQSPHYWYVFAQLGIESSFLLELKRLKVDAFYLCEGNTLLDKWTKRFYDTHKIRYALTKKGERMKTTIGAFGDFIVQYDYPEDLFRQVESFYRKAASLETMNLSQIAKLSEFKSSITFTVIRNRAIAEKVKRDILSKFGKDNVLNGKSGD